MSTEAEPVASLDVRMMRLALAAAEGGRTAPNPRVGAVIARGDAVIATGFHRKAGQPHAEVEALRAAGDAARGATLYCTLEPCNHHGRTPPCTDAILAAGLARVVLGARDPARHGQAPGIERLRAHGVEVVTGVCEAEADALIEDFACLVQRRRPLVVLKAAVTLDGRIATRTGDSRWITGAAARAEAHRMRARADAILVGVGTVCADDPRLDVRDAEGPSPTVVVLDGALRTPIDAALLRVKGRGPALVFHGPNAARASREALARAGAVLVEAPLDPATGRLALDAVLAELGRRDVMRLLVEGGARVHGALLDAGLVDRAAVFVAPRLLGDPSAIPLAHGARSVLRIEDGARLEGVSVRTFGDDVLVEGRLATRAGH